MRSALLASQVLATLVATCLAVLTITGAIQLWMVFVFAFLLGVASAGQQATSSVYLFLLVDKDRLTNAVSLNLMMFNLARVLGPSLGGFTIALIGIGPCFALNAISFLPVIWVLVRTKSSDLG